MIRTHRHLRVFAIGLVWSLTIGFDEASAQGDEAQALRVVRGEIQNLEDRLASQQAELNTGLLALKEAELKAAAAARALRENQEQLAAQHTRRLTLVEDTRLAKARLDRERGVLAQQVRMSYVTGRQEMLKLLLNQENPARLGRMVTYYDYLNRARSQRLDAVGSEIEALTLLAMETAQVARELSRLERAKAEELGVVESSRDERR